MAGVATTTHDRQVDPGAPVVMLMCGHGPRVAEEEKKEKENPTPLHHHTNSSFQTPKAAKPSPGAVRLSARSP